jgi:hypothetical protein
LALATLHTRSKNNNNNQTQSLLEKTYHAAQSVQDSLLRGNLHRYDTVSTFLDEQYSLVPRHVDPDRLQKLHILVTDLNFPSSSSSPSISASGGGVVVKRPRNRQELLDALTQTTHIPWITGPWRWDGVDGGFSRRLHRSCDCNDRIDVPWNRETIFHFLNPGALTQQAVNKLFASGQRDARRKVKNMDTLYADKQYLHEDYDLKQENQFLPMVSSKKWWTWNQQK